jgi:hypothetical protein
MQIDKGDVSTGSDEELYRLLSLSLDGNNHRGRGTLT